MKKIALCVGINNYPGNNQLTWPVKDAKDWTALLSSKGFTTAALLDQKATRHNIMETLKGLLAQCSDGDSFVFQFSGHGTQVPDLSKDEGDKLDEAICCYDLFSEPGLIFDDEFWSIFTHKPAGVKCVAFMDCCHSQTIMKALNFDPPDANLVKRSIDGWSIPEKSRTRVSRREVPDPRAPWPVCEFSGCESQGYSYDAHDLKNGAFTHYAIKEALQLGPKETNNDWFIRIRSHLPTPRYPQKPRLTGSYLKHIALS